MHGDTASLGVAADERPVAAVHAPVQGGNTGMNIDECGGNLFQNPRRQNPGPAKQHNVRVEGLEGLRSQNPN